jgi:hypothetical protein
MFLPLFAIFVFKVSLNLGQSGAALRWVAKKNQE